MATVLLRFPGSRYHATPWGHHVNEGLVEWPPSPWRLLRALIAVGYTSGSWSGGGPLPTARSLLEKLAGKLPLYRLPPAAGAHSRHYMPLARIEKGREQTTLVFDTWAQMDGDPLAVFWDVELTGDEHEVLAELVGRLGYLGRSESWVAAHLVVDEPLAANTFNCFPDDGGKPLRRGMEQVSLLACQSAAAYRVWRENAVADARSSHLETNKKASGKIRRDVEGAYPSDVVACLHAETAWLRRQGWSQPPGTRRVFYWRRVDALEAGAPPPAIRARSGAPVDAMLLSLTSASGSSGLLPPVVRTVPQAELLHRALVSQITTLSGQPCPVLSGCDENGQRLRGAHQHAHVLPLDLDGDRHLDHVLVWAPMRLDANAQAAVRAVRRTFTKGVEAPLRLAVAGSGTLDGFRTIRGPAGARLRNALGPTSGATDWLSATPFVPPRFLKKRGRNTLEGQIAEELAARGLPPLVYVRTYDPHADDQARRQRLFVRARRYGPSPPLDVGFTLLLRLAASAMGPICLGYGSHFGLGRFETVLP